MPSFQRALDLAVDGIELDVYWAHDTLWVIHDATLERTTNGSGTLSDQSPTQLRKLDAGNGAAIPHLEQVLDLIPASVTLNIELKGPATAEPVFNATRDWPPEQLLISSFDHGQLHRYRAAGGCARIGVLLDRWQPEVIETAQQLSAWSINLSKRITTGARVRRIHDQGFRVLVYTVNHLRSARRLASYGVDGLFTDRPDRINRAALAG